MSNADYVAKLDEGQLTNLIEQASAKLEELRQSGWVKLWTVSVSWANVGWFPETDHSAAVEFACTKAKEAAAKRPGKGIEMEVSLERYRPSEAAELLAAVPAPKGEQHG